MGLSKDYRHSRQTHQRKGVRLKNGRRKR